MPMNTNPTGTTSQLVTFLAQSYADASTTTRSSDILVQSATVPAGLMAAGDTLRARFDCNFTNTGGSSETFTPKLRIGATTIMASSTAIGTVSGGTKQPVIIDLDIHLVSLTSQRCSGRIFISTRQTTLPAGLDTNSTYGGAAALLGLGFDTTVAENFANATTVGLVVNMSNVGTATSTFTVTSWTLERLSAT